MCIWASRNRCEQLGVVGIEECGAPVVDAVFRGAARLVSRRGVLKLARPRDTVGISAALLHILHIKHAGRG